MFSLALIGSAAAQSTDYCPPDSANCKTVNISNWSEAVVKNVNIIQQPTDGACTKDDRTFTENMARSVEFQARLNTVCKYKVKFRTVSQCTGDKTAYFTPKKFSNGASEAPLQGECSDLKT
jgi:hypothetical protein